MRDIAYCSGIRFLQDSSAVLDALCVSRVYLQLYHLVPAGDAGIAIKDAEVSLRCCSQSS